MIERSAAAVIVLPSARAGGRCEERVEGAKETDGRKEGGKQRLQSIRGGLQKNVSTPPTQTTERQTTERERGGGSGGGKRGNGILGLPSSRLD